MYKIYVAILGRFSSTFFQMVNSSKDLHGTFNGIQGRKFNGHPLLLEIEALQERHQKYGKIAKTKHKRRWQGDLSTTTLHVLISGFKSG